jgi:glucose/arabinose dehydrogenase
MRAILPLLAGLLAAMPLRGLAQPPPITPQPFVSGLAQPVEVVPAFDDPGRLYVVEQVGRIRVIRNGVVLPAPFLDITSKVKAGGEQGLLGLAFHPLDRSRFYVYYTRDRAGDPGGNEIVVERYGRSTADPTLGDAGSGLPLLVIPHPTHGNHNGGKLAFGPDNHLYVAVGDGGGGGDPFGAGQSLADLRGKILRLDVDPCCGQPYAIPPDNPFVATGGARPEIWSYGWRNPWRFSFDRATGDMLIGDVGQGAWEEIDFEPAGVGGRNYGWSVLEGTHCYNPSSGCNTAGKTMPVIEYGHNGSGGFSVTGGFRYRGTTRPALAGYYLYGDYVSGRIWAASPGAGGNWTTTQVGSLANLSTFGEDESGELYAADREGGTIHRLTPAATTIPRLANISTRARALQGDDVVIAGFVVGGGAKTVALVATGPSLAASGVAQPLANPTLTLVRSSDQAVLAANDDWQGAANAAQLQAVGFAPSHPQEAAILATLPPGAYTAIASGVGGATGVTVAAVYEVDHPERPLLNLSTRARVQTGEDVMIGGLVVQGTAPRTVAIVATGPSLAAHGISGFLANPTLTLVRSSDQAVIASNDDWQSAPNAAQLQASGFAPSHPSEAAILATLPPGAYTAIVSGVGGATGVSVVGVYSVP